MKLKLVIGYAILSPVILIGGAIVLVWLPFFYFGIGILKFFEHAHANAGFALRHLDMWLELGLRSSTDSLHFPGHDYAPFDYKAAKAKLVAAKAGKGALSPAPTQAPQGALSLDVRQNELTRNQERCKT